MNFVRKSLNSLVKLQQMFRIAETELGMENTIGITLETGVGVPSTILHVCPDYLACFVLFFFCFFLMHHQSIKTKKCQRTILLSYISFKNSV